MNPATDVFTLDATTHTVHYVAFGRGSPAGVFYEAHYQGNVLCDIYRGQDRRWRTSRNRAKSHPTRRQATLQALTENLDSDACKNHKQDAPKPCLS